MKRNVSPMRSSSSTKISPSLKAESIRSDSIDIIHADTAAVNGDEFRPSFSDVVVVGAGPSGLMLAFVYPRVESKDMWLIMLGRVEITLCASE